MESNVIDDTYWEVARNSALRYVTEYQNTIFKTQNTICRRTVSSRK